MKLNICIIDDEKTFATVLKQTLHKQGYAVDTAFTAESGLKKVLTGNFDLVILDMHLPDGSGLDVLKRIREKRDDCDIIVGTAYGSIEYAVQAMRLGAIDFISKPFRVEDLSLILERIMRQKAIQKELSIFKAINRFSEDVQFIPGQSSSMQAVYKMALAAAKMASTSILIQGETGTGKGYLANFIHKNSPKASQPMLQLNCAAMPESLVESELFGYQAGAFTGAQKLKKGLLELADGGLLFLDEIGDMSIQAQAKLLQVLETGKFRRIGGLSDISVDIWVIAATNKNLQEAVKAGRFRLDLFYRLNVVTLDIPPLRERKEDLRLYTEHFISEFSQKMNKRILGITEAAAQRFMEYTWPGNLRELRNVIERAVLLTPDNSSISVDVLPLSQLQSHQTGMGLDKADFWRVFQSSGKDLKSFLDDIEKSVLAHVLEECHGNQSEAARRLGIPKHIIKYRVKKLLNNTQDKVTDV